MIHFTFEKLEISCNNVWWPCSHKSKLVQCLTGELQILSTGRIISLWQISEAQLTKVISGPKSRETSLVWRSSTGLVWDIAENQVPNNCFRFSFSPSKSWASTKRVRTPVPSLWTRNIMWWCSLESPVVELKYVFPRLKAETIFHQRHWLLAWRVTAFPIVDENWSSSSSDFVSVFQSRPLNGKACHAKYRMLDRIESKIFPFCSILMHVVQIANHQYHLLLSLTFFG